MLYFDRDVLIAKGVSIPEALQAIKDGYDLGWDALGGEFETTGYRSGSKLRLLFVDTIVAVHPAEPVEFESYSTKVQIGQYEGLK